MDLEIRRDPSDLNAVRAYILICCRISWYAQIQLNGVVFQEFSASRVHHNHSKLFRSFNI